MATNDPTADAARDLGVNMRIGSGDLSQSPQAMRHGNADPYTYPGEVSFGGLNDAEHENAGAWEIYGSK
jgi:hypothetical protein